MKKIVVVSGSPRIKGKTMTMVKLYEQGIKELDVDNRIELGRVNLKKKGLL